MTVLALVLASLALLVALFVAAALVEIYEGTDVGFRDDHPVPVELGDAVGKQPSAFGLPAELDEGGGVVLFVSPSCPACYDLVGSVAKRMPEGLHLVVAATSADLAREWLHGLGAPVERCTIDADHRIVGSLGLQGTPVALAVERGLVSGATSVPSAKWLRSLMEEVTV